MKYILFVLPLLLVVPITHGQIYVDQNNVNSDTALLLKDIEYKYGLNNPSISDDIVIELNNNATNIALNFQINEQKLLEQLELLESVSGNELEMQIIIDELESIGKDAIYEIITLFTQYDIRPIFVMSIEEQQMFLEEYNKVLTDNNLPLLNLGVDMDTQTDMVSSDSDFVTTNMENDGLLDRIVDDTVVNVIDRVNSITWFGDYLDEKNQLMIDNDIDPLTVNLIASESAKEMIYNRIVFIIENNLKNEGYNNNAIDSKYINNIIDVNLDKLVVVWLDSFERSMSITYNDILFEKVNDDIYNIFMKYGVLIDEDITIEQEIAINVLTSEYQYELNMIGNPYIPLQEKQRVHLIISSSYLPGIYEICECVKLLTPNSVNKMDIELSNLRLYYNENKL